MKAAYILFGFVLFLAGCGKGGHINDSDPSAGNFVEYFIEKGSHYSINSPYKPVELNELRFIVKFDSSAIYQTASPVNQYDINKLFGFSDNNADHHEYSARIGWRWSDNNLHLFAYVYNEGTMTSEDMGIYPIGFEISCSIRVAGTKYMITAGNRTVELLRLSSASKAKGYQLYPYFGGDEEAPHDIRIRIRNLQ